MELRRQVDPELEQEFECILEYAKEKFRSGAEKHGIFDPATDIVDRLKEAETELIDCINYCLMQIVKLKRIRNKIKDL